MRTTSAKLVQHLPKLLRFAKEIAMSQNLPFSGFKKSGAF
jgi:hypothetical protein